MLKDFIFNKKLIFFVVVTIPVFAGSYLVVRAQNIIPTRVIEVTPNSGVSNTPTPTDKPCSFLEKLEEQDGILASMSLGIRPNEIKYNERRISQGKNGYPSISNKSMKEREMDLGFELLDTVACKTSVIKVSTKITSEGVNIIAPAGYKIKIVERSSGIKWNLWNTLYEVTQPANVVVIKNSFPVEETTAVTKMVKNKYGKLVATKVQVKKIKNFLYAPYSENIANPEIIEAGRDYVKTKVKEAMQELKDRGVKSKAFPGEFVAGSDYLPESYFQRLPFLEQGDLTEFVENPAKNTERTLVILGSNKDAAFVRTGSKAGALGWVQYTSRTWKEIRKAYPAAGLPADFEAGASDHKYSMMAAILLHDYNLRDLVKKFGKNVLKDPNKLEEYLASAYNGSPSRVKQSLSASILHSITDWAEALSSKKGGLANETKGYLVKLRYLQQNNLP